MPVFVLAVMFILLALAIVLDAPYIMYIWLGLTLVWALWSGNQVMQLENWGCLDWLVILLDVLIIVLFIWTIFFVSY